MKQTIVIKVAMTCDKCRSKAMALVAATSGVDSVKLAGDHKDQVVVEGDGVDSVKLTCMLRKKVGAANLVEVVDVAKKKKDEEEKKKKDEEEKKKEEEKAAAACYSYCPPTYKHCPPYVVCEQGPDHACSIM